MPNSLSTATYQFINEEITMMDNMPKFDPIPRNPTKREMELTVSLMWAINKIRHTTAMVSDYDICMMSRCTELLEEAMGVKYE